jgi:mannose-6-phosphate isomerase
MLTQDFRPWGKWEEYLDEPGYRLKRNIVDSGKRFSLQTHELRSEVWIIVRGTGLATVGPTCLRVASGDVLQVPRAEVHRLHNDGSEPLVFIEVQLGVCKEDDIVRIEDDWNRTNT